jgi:hypothetical protein
MADTTHKLHETLAIIYEMEGMAGVEKYAKANHIPMSVRRKLVAAYEASQRKPNGGSSS